MSEAVQGAALSQQLIEKAGDGVIIASNDGTILEWSAGAERIFGWSREQAVGENIDMMIPDNQKDQHWEGYDRVLGSGETKFGGSGDLLTVSAQKADGSRVGVEMSFTPLEQDGAITAIGAIVRPVRRAARPGGDTPA
jgi:PAS domain S-box-containing protein